MDKNIEELLRNMDLVYTSGSEIRVNECIRLARLVLLTGDALDVSKCKNMTRSTPLRLISINEGKAVGIGYKDISIEFYSQPLSLC